MIRTVRRVQLLTVLALLHSGLLQPLASAQGGTCTRGDLAAAVAPQARAPGTGGAVAAPEARPTTVADDHRHAPIPQPDAPRAPSAPCGAAAVPAEGGPLPLTIVTRHLLAAGDPSPASLLIRSLFRPPRLS